MPPSNDKDRKINWQFRFLKPIIRKEKRKIMEQPAANPSNPSSQLKELTTATIHKEVIIRLKRFWRIIFDCKNSPIKIFGVRIWNPICQIGKDTKN